MRGRTQGETEKKRRDVSLGVFENHKFRVIFTAPSDDPGGRTAEPSARSTHVEPQRKAEGKFMGGGGGETGCDGAEWSHGKRVKKKRKTRR